MEVRVAGWPDRYPKQSKFKGVVIRFLVAQIDKFAVYVDSRCPEAMKEKARPNASQ
jgi:hypothetical protein